jgi:hypothetical protein
MLKKKSNSHDTFRFLLKVKNLKMKLKHGLVKRNKNKQFSFEEVSNFSFLEFFISYTKYFEEMM